MEEVTGAVDVVQAGRTGEDERQVQKVAYAYVDAEYDGSLGLPLAPMLASSCQGRVGINAKVACLARSAGGLSEQIWAESHRRKMDLHTWGDAVQPFICPSQIRRTRNPKKERVDA